MFVLRPRNPQSARHESGGATRSTFNAKSGEVFPNDFLTWIQKDHDAAIGGKAPEPRVAAVPSPASSSKRSPKGEPESGTFCRLAGIRRQRTMATNRMLWMDDASVIQRVLAGEREAYRVLVERYQQSIFGLLRH